MKFHGRVHFHFFSHESFKYFFGVFVDLCRQWNPGENKILSHISRLKINMSFIKVAEIFLELKHILSCTWSFWDFIWEISIFKLVTSDLFFSNWEFIRPCKINYLVLSPFFVKIDEGGIFSSFFLLLLKNMEMYNTFHSERGK